MPSNAGGGAPTIIGSAGTGGIVTSAYIETVGFLNNELGNPRPVLLFNGGRGTENLAMVTKSAAEVSADIAAFPQKWWQWRRTASGFERDNGKGWTAFPYQFEVRPLPSGTKLVGQYQHSQDVVGAALLQQTVQWKFTEMSFQSCDSSELRGAGLPFVDNINASGNYTAGGYVLQTARSNGTRTTEPLFFDPATPGRLWIGPSYFVSSAGPLCRFTE